MVREKPLGTFGSYVLTVAERTEDDRDAYRGDFGFVIHYQPGKALTDEVLDAPAAVALAAAILETVRTERALTKP